MKKITLLLLIALISVVGTAQVVVLEDFSSIGVNVGNGATGDFGGFGGLAASLTTDMSDDVGQTVNDVAGEPWQGAYITVDTNFMDLTTTKTVSIDIYNNDGNTIYLLGQVEGPQNMAPSPSTSLMTHSGSGWETITFDFATPANGTVANGEYGQFTIYTSVNSAGGFVGDSSDPMVDAVDVTLLLDDLSAVAGALVTPPPPVDFPLDFESLTSSEVSGFDGCTATVEAVGSPQDTGNASSQLLKLVRNGGQVWAGVSIDVDTDVDFSTNRYVTFELWTNAPTSTPIVFKTEQVGTPTNTTGDQTVNSASQNAWHTLVYDLNAFSALMNQNRLVIIPNLGTTGDGSLEYFIDNMQNVNVLSDGSSVSLENKISVFPNPSSDGTWRVLTSVPITNIALYDILGKQVLDIEPLTNSATIDGTQLKSGIYMARISTENGTKTMKLVRQ